MLTLSHAFQVVALGAVSLSTSSFPSIKMGQGQSLCGFHCRPRPWFRSARPAFLSSENQAKVDEARRGQFRHSSTAIFASGEVGRHDDDG